MPAASLRAQPALWSAVSVLALAFACGESSTDSGMESVTSVMPTNSVPNAGPSGTTTGPGLMPSPTTSTPMPSQTATGPGPQPTPSNTVTAGPTGGPAPTPSQTGPTGPTAAPLPTTTPTGGMGGASGQQPGPAAGGAGGDGPSTPTVPTSTPSDLPPNPSGLMEPGEGGVAQPSGTAGNLKVLPWAGFSGAVSYSFDDNSPSQFNNGDQLLALGVPFTWYLWTARDGSSHNFYQRALEAGHEIGNHTSTHGGGTNEVNAAQMFIQDTYGVTAYTMAAPEGITGNYNDVTNQLFLLDRGVSGNPVGPDEDFNKLNFPTTLPPTNAGAAQMNPQIDSAVSQGRWQTYCIHGFDGDGYQPLSFSGFLEHINYAKTKDIWIGTMEYVAAYHIARRLLNDLTPTTEGSDQVYTWTLPDIFPPGKYVRVTVDGGTLSQDGVALPWNDHGFYEVALDAGNLTLSP